MCEGGGGKSCNFWPCCFFCPPLLHLVPLSLAASPAPPPTTPASPTPTRTTASAPPPPSRGRPRLAPALPRARLCARRPWLGPRRVLNACVRQSPSKPLVVEPIARLAQWYLDSAEESGTHEHQQGLCKQGESVCFSHCTSSGRAQCRRCRNHVPRRPLRLPALGLVEMRTR